MNVLGKSPSPMRVAVIAGAVAWLASAVTPVHAAAPVRSKAKIAAKPLQPQQVSAAPAPSPARKTGGGSAGRLSLQWMIGAELRP